MRYVTTMLVIASTVLMAVAAGVVAADADGFSVASIDGEPATEVNELVLQQGSSIQLEFDDVDASEHHYRISLGGSEYELAPHHDGSLELRGEVPPEGVHVMEVTMVVDGEPEASAETEVEVVHSGDTARTREGSTATDSDQVRERESEDISTSDPTEIDEGEVSVVEVNGDPVDGGVEIVDYLENPIELELTVDGLEKVGDPSDRVLVVEYGDRTEELEPVEEDVLAPTRTGEIYGVDEGSMELALVLEHRDESYVLDRVRVELVHSDEAYEGEHWQGEGEAPDVSETDPRLIDRIVRRLLGDDTEGEGEDSIENGSNESGDAVDGGSGDPGLVDRIVEGVFG